MGCLFDALAYDVGDFLQFFHQVELSLKSSGGVDDQDIYITGQCRIDGVKGDRTRIGTLALRDNRYTDAIGPSFDLLNRCGTECVRRSNHYALTNVIFIAISELG